MWQSFWQLVVGLIVGLPLALGLAGFAGYFLARRALSPVERMARRARGINAERFSARASRWRTHTTNLAFWPQAFRTRRSRLGASSLNN